MDGSIALDGAVSKLTPQDQRELQQFVQNESQKNQIQSCKSDVNSNHVYAFAIEFILFG